MHFVRYKELQYMLGYLRDVTEESQSAFPSIEHSGTHLDRPGYIHSVLKPKEATYGYLCFSDYE